MTLSTMESFSRRLLSSPSCEVDLDESGCNSPAASVYTHTPVIRLPISWPGSRKRREGGRGEVRTVGSSGEALFGLVDAGLGRVRRELLFGTVGKRLAEGVRHVCFVCCGLLFDGCVVVVL